MSALAQAPLPRAIVYPESDGLPMSDNTKQFRWIVTIQGGLDTEFRDDPNVFVAGNLLWYPIEGNNLVRGAPDIFVVFGRPKGDRGSYLQWLEGNIAPQVVFEIVSPGNRAGELINKFKFYERRHQGELTEITTMQGWISPRLKVRFETVDGELCLYGSDGKRFATYVELAEQRDKARRAEEQARRAEEQARRAEEQARQATDQERQAKEEARQAADQERQAKETAQMRAARLAAQLRALGVEPEPDAKD
jgi:Uma2 family endonuclease